MSREVPEPWATRMIRVGLTDPRNGRPSMTRLAEAADTHASTVSAMMHGTRTTSQDVIDRVAKALWPEASDLARRRREVRQWVGQALENASPFKLHPDADLLTTKERATVNELIRLLAASKKQGGMAHGNAAATNQQDQYDLAALEDPEDPPGTPHE